jgi:hypothetical protein
LSATKIIPPASARETLDRDERNSAASQPWIFPTRGLAFRLFATCWLVYAVHLATNTVREIIPAITIAEHLSFHVDEYANLHPDIFEKKDFGWFIDGNPGASMIAALPYFASRPIVDPIVAAVNRSRAASGRKEPPPYNSPWPMAQEFYRESWRRGLDVKLGLAAIVTQVLCMAPLSALGVVAMFFLLRHVFQSDRSGLWLSLLYAFGTPVFYRAALLNQNMLIGHFMLMGFMVIWNPGGLFPWSDFRRYFLGGLAAGLSLLLDYSGAILVAGLFCYGVFKAFQAGEAPTTKRNAWLWFGLGTAGPILMLWFYQWRCFGNFILPVEHWMPLPPVKEVHVGYQGFTFVQPVLLRMLLFDYRFGLFVTCPLLLLAFGALWLNRKPGSRRGAPRIPGLEFSAMLLFSLALIVFFSGWTAVHLQFTYGMRYLAPVLPFLFVPAAMVLMRFPRWLALIIGILSVAEAWSMSMYRDVERGFGVLDTILHVFIGGFQLPALTVFSRMGATYGDYAAGGASPLPIFVLVAAVLAVVWRQAGRARNV